MRPLAAVLLFLLSPLAAAQQNARIAFLSRQLTQASDPRLRAQSAILLGATHDGEAVLPLCGALSDVDALVRSAAAKALGELRLPKGAGCLERLRADPNRDVRLAAATALESIHGPSAKGALYVAIESVADRSGALSPEVLHLVEESLKAKLVSMGAVLAPQGEAKAAAQAVLRQRKLKGYLLLIELHPEGEKGLRVVVLCSTYPERSLQGQVSVKATGGSPAALVKALIPRAVDEAADEFEWSR